MSESSSDEVLLDCSSLPPLARADLQTFLERQPEVQSVTGNDVPTCMVKPVLEYDFELT
jgi:hypothetical protein